VPLPDVPRAVSQNGSRVVPDDLDSIGNAGSHSDQVATPQQVPPLPQLLQERYAVESEIGRGGFGRVVVARDERLERRVAIKLLVSGLRTTSDERRLEREARLMGSLDHPNIVTVHDVGRSDGEPYIVTELLRGTPLRVLLRAGPLPLPRALDLCMDLVRGLAAAHERGIIHRDIKPENLFVTSEGTLKILDFGVAFVPKTAGTVRGTVGDEDSRSSMLRIAGTVGYAAPEQLRGADVDARADLFSAGAVLYEMLTGRRAFEGATRFDVGHAALHLQPAPLPADIPPAVSAIVRRCLGKDPQGRFQTAKDLLFNLELAAASLAGPPRSKTIRWLPVWAAALAAAVVAAIALSRWLVDGPKPSFRQVTFFGGAVTSARFGGSSEFVFYTEAWDGSPPRVYQTRIGSSELQRLEVPDAILAAASHDGQLAVLLAPQFNRGDFIGTLARTTLSGGAPRQLLEQVEYADWSPEGSALAAVRTVGGKSRLEYPLGHLVLESTDRLVEPRISPDGQRVAVLLYPRMGHDQPAVAMVDRAGSLRVLSRGWRDARGLAWSPGGEAIWFTATASNQAGAQSELRSVTLSGKERSLLREAGNLELQDVSRDGRVLVTRPVAQAGIAYSDERGERDLSFLDVPMLSDISRDGKRILFFSGGSGLAAAATIYVRDTDGSPPVAIGTGLAAAFSPDGSQVLSIPVNAGELQPVSLLPVGPGSPRTLDLPGIAAIRGGFLPDGRVLVVGQEAGKALKLYVVGSEGGAPRAISPEGIYYGYFSASPDGKWVAAVDSSFRTTLYAADGGMSASLPEIPPGHFPIGWTDKGALLLIRPPDVPMPIYHFDLAERRMETWRTLRGPPSASGIRTVFVTPDGRALAYNFGTKRTHLYLVEGLR